MSAEERTADTGSQVVAAELVAYLDGELDATACRAVEERLSRDAGYRQVLRELQQSWDMLDQLPRAEADEAFTQSTVAMVAVTASGEVEAMRRRNRTRGRRLFWAGIAGSVLGLAAGYFAVAVLARRTNRQVLRDLPVIERVDEYLYLDNVEFLRTLEREGLFAEEASPTAEPSSDWSQRLQQMSPAEKKELSAKQERFYRLEVSEQDRLRKLHADSSADPEADRLRSVLDRYTAWLKTLPSGQRAELLNLPATDRVGEIERLMQERKASEMRHFMALKLKDEDAAAISRWMAEVVKTREPEILRKYPMLTGGLERWDDPKRRTRFLMGAVHGLGAARELLRPTPEEIERLRNVLSPEARLEFDNAKKEGRLQELAEGWIWAAAFRPPPVDPEQLREFYHKDLSPAEREYLESLPPERMQLELRQKFHFHRWRNSSQFGPGPFPFKGSTGGPRGWPRPRGGDRRTDADSPMSGFPKENAKPPAARGPAGT